jgi:hypothetical protein
MKLKTSLILTAKEGVNEVNEISDLEFTPEILSFLGRIIEKENTHRVERFGLVKLQMAYAIVELTQPLLHIEGYITDTMQKAGKEYLISAIGQVFSRYIGGTDNWKYDGWPGYKIDIVFRDSIETLIK